MEDFACNLVITQITLFTAHIIQITLFTALSLLHPDCPHNGDYTLASSGGDYPSIFLLVFTTVV